MGMALRFIIREWHGCGQNYSVILRQETVWNDIGGYQHDSHIDIVSADYLKARAAAAQANHVDVLR
jgi:hypothetical protein